MKKYLLDFFAGVGLGIIFFYTAALVFEINTAFINPTYHIISALVIFSVYTFLRHEKFAIYRFVLFSIGFGAPSLIWFILGNLGASNFSAL